MIEIKTYSKPKKTGGSGGSSSSTKYISGVISEAEHAGRADKAKRAEVADQANYAGTAASAQNAAYASEAGNLHADAEILQKYLSLEDTVEPQVVNGMVIFAKGLISNLLAQLKGGASFGSDGSYSFDEDGNLVIESAHSRDFDEMLQNGFALKRNPTSGKYTLSISDLIVWGRMVINTLETRKKYAIGGNVYLSGASSKIQHVEKVYSEDGETVVGYKCYILKDDGTMATQNGWVVGDQALCQTFDIEEGVYQNVSNQYYWRLVTQVSEENVAITEKYIDKDGNEQIRELYEGQKFAWVVLSKDDCDTNSGIPASGDTIVMDGHRLTENEDTDYTERTNVLMLEATGSGSPRIIALTGIVDYKHETDNEVFILSPQKVIFTTEHFEIRTASGAPITFVHFMGPWVEGTEYHYYDQVSHANALWTCIVEKGKSTTDEPTDGNVYWRKEMSGGKGEKGDDGKTPQPTGSVETYYAITSSPSTEPDDSSWTTTPIDTSKYQGKFLWTDNRTEWKIGDKTEWISNKTCSYIGKDGSNGTSVSIKGSLSDIGELPTSGNVNGDSYLIDGYLWIYTGTSVDDDNHHNGFENVGKIKGEDGISATQYYYHVAWMNTSDNSDNSFTTTNPSGSSYAYIGTLIDTTENDSDDYTKYDWAYVKGDRGEEGKNAVRLDLTNESSTVTCDKDGNIIGTIQGTVAILYDGAKEADINMVSYFISSYKGLSSMPTISEGGVISGLSVSGGKTSLEASINIKAVYKNQDYYATYTITKVLAGSDGTPATTYWIEPSATAIKVDSDGNANPSTITCRQYKQVGAESPVAGDKKIYYRHNAIDSTLWNEYTESIIPAVNVEAYEFVLSDRIPSNSSAIIYDRESIPVVKDGSNGDDTVSYNINFVTYKDDVHNDTILYVYVVRSVGKESTSTLISNIPEISETAGLEVRVYCDGDYNENLTNHVKWSGSIQRSVWETVKNFEVRLYLDDKLVSSNSYSFGEDGDSALEILVTPETLAFDTNDYGVVPPETSKQASISCYRNGVKVTNVSYLKSAEENCLASVSESNGSATVTISRITSQEVADTRGNSSTISNTSGYATIQVWDKDTNLYHRVQVKFMVNVAKFTGQMVNTNKQFSKTLTEVGNKVDNKMDSFDLTEFKAEITQTAREISLSVSEKSFGRRNLLVGSAFLREDNHYKLSRDTRIEMNSGYNGSNCIKVIDDTDGTSHYIGVYWDGAQGGRSVKIEKGKKYTISCYYKTNDSNAKFSLEAIYTDKATNAKRLGRPKFLSPNFFNPKYNQWELFTTVIDTTDAESDYIAFNFWEYCKVDAGRINAYICRPMVEEGDTYNGWTLSQDDYDIIGANLIDNSRTLDTGGNVIEAKGQKALVGDAYELTYRGSDDYNSFYRIDASSFKLDTDYTISFEVRGDAKNIGVYALYPITNTKFTFYAEPKDGAMFETNGDGKTIRYVGLIEVEELSKQHKVWCHFRFKDRLPEQIYFQFPKNAEQTGVTSWSVTITRPKIEAGAVVTEYTERKSDLVDKASLKAAGILVDAESVTLYGNQVHIKKNKTDANDTVLIDNETGKVSAGLIDADKVVAEGIQAKNLEATNLKVTGNSKFGIWEIVKDDTFGEMIQARGDLQLPSGESVAGSGIGYLPLFIRGGTADAASYFRVGVTCTEFSYPYNGINDFCGVWVGKAADYVCGGVTNTSFNIPYVYGYNTSYHPAGYIYAKKSSPNDPAFAINVQNPKGTAGERTAIQTNAAIRGVLAPNAISINNTGTIPNGIGVVICTNGYEMTLTLPANPLEGQTLIIIQGSDKRVYIVPSGDEVIYCGGQTRDRNNKFFSGMIGQFNIFVFIRGNWQLQWMNYKP